MYNSSTSFKSISGDSNIFLFDTISTWDTNLGFLSLRLLILLEIYETATKKIYTSQAGVK